LILTCWLRQRIWIFPADFWKNPQWIFQKHWKCPYWVASERDDKIFYENQSIRDLFDFESSFQNCFWNLLRISGLSEICKIRNVWKFPSHSQRALRSLVLKDFLEFEKIILEVKMSNKFKNGNEIFFSHERLPCESLNFFGLRTPSKKSQTMETLYLKNFRSHFWICWTIFLPKWWF
jgi:hypothetical protein